MLFRIFRNDQFDRILQFFKRKNLESSLLQWFLRFLTLISFPSNPSFLKNEVILIDGTKIEEYANKFIIVWKRSIEKDLTNLNDKSYQVYEVLCDTWYGFSFCQQIHKLYEQQTAENILNRDFKAAEPNQKWVTDVTELKYGTSQKAYLSAILDLYDGSIRAFVLGHSNNNQLVFDTFELALQGHREAVPCFIVQYTSHAFRHITRVAGITQSMSRVGKCIDNDPMESFWESVEVLNLLST